MTPAAKLFADYLKLDEAERYEFDRERRSHLATIGEPSDSEWLVLAKAYKKEWDKRTKSDWQGMSANHRSLTDAALQIFADARARQLDPVAQCTAVVRGFFADAFAKSTGYACGGLAKNPLKYLESRQFEDQGPSPIAKLEAKLDDARQRGDHARSAHLQEQIEALIIERRKAGR